MDGTRKYHPKCDNPITKEHTWYALTNKWILTPKLRIPTIQFIEQKKLKKKEDQSIDALVLLRKANKILTGGNMETKYGAEPEGNLETAPPGNLSHSQSPSDTIVYAKKCLMTGNWHSCFLRGSARGGCYSEPLD